MTTVSAADRNACRAPPVYVGSDIFRRTAFGRNHPLSIVRHATVMELTELLGWLPSGAFREARPAPVSRLVEFHDPDYVEALRRTETAGRVSREEREKYDIGTLCNPLFDGLFERAATTVGGSLLAAELACEGQVAFHPSGGTHHGRRDRASGFCYFNDPVFAIRRFRELGRRRVLYVDLDAHHGDGVEDAFRDCPDVMTLSVHEEARWPHSGAAGYDGARAICNLPVPKGFNDSELDYLVTRTLLPVASAFSPDALVLVCGADCLAGDPLSGMMLNNTALWSTVERLLALGRPTVVLGGGGYNPWTVARYWAGLWATLNGYPIPERLPAAAIACLEGLECDLVDDDDIERAWIETLADAPRRDPVRDAVKSLATLVAGAAGAAQEGGPHALARSSR